ncbi:MAG TPA: phosphoribosylformylglycinamidine synthase subunit PurS [Pyrinomonadaceae bacterium]|nr:phosphoribosylformylglycinamidine synthase subunit PurS [Pyrinomonadaceae bacterium]
MKAFIYVNLKPSVLDPQGKAIHHSALSLGFDGIADIRQGKFFKLEFAENVTEDSARDLAERLANEMLSNPVIEDYKVQIINE